MRIRWTHFALALAATGAGSCVSNDLPSVAFRCSPTDPPPICPNNYTCQSGYCIRDGVTVPTRLATNLPDRETAFSAHTLANNHVLVCWNAAPDARLPSIFAAEIDNTGAAVIAPGPIAVNPQAPAVVDGLVGDCALIGDRIAVLTEAIVDTRKGMLQLFNIDSANPTLGTTSAMMSQAFAQAVTPFNGQEVPGDPTLGPMDPGPTAWFFYAQLATPPDERTFVGRLIVNSNFDFSGIHHLHIEDFQLGTQISTSEFHYGTGGGWLSVIIRGGQIRNAWESLTDDPTHYIADPVPTYLAAFPLAVRGNELALAVNTLQSGDDNTWQLFWITPGPDDINDPGHSGSVIKPGPIFHLSREVIRPGGYADHDRLLLATGQVSNGQSAVVISQVPWEADATVTPMALQTITKISTLSARRLSLGSAGGQFLVFWTEQVPESSAGFTGYSALYVSPTTVVAPP